MNRIQLLYAPINNIVITYMLFFFNRHVCRPYIYLLNNNIYDILIMAKIFRYIC